MYIVEYNSRVKDVITYRFRLMFNENVLIILIMSMKIVNFKKFEISAASAAEAKAVIGQHFNVLGEATQAYKKAKEAATNGWTDKDITAFCLDYLEKKSKMTAGNGYIVTLDSAISDTRERPYRFENVKNNGKRNQKKALTWVDPETGTPVSKPIYGTKAQAMNELKKMYKKGYKGSPELVIDYQVNNPVVARAFYTPSKNTKKGTWLAFGVEA